VANEAEHQEPATISHREQVECPLDIVQLIRDHHADVYRYAFRLTGAQPDAEDLTQQAFLIAQQKLHQVRDPGKARSWLFTIVRNCYLKQLRRPAPEPAASLELTVEHIPDDSVPPAGAESEWIDREWLQAALDQLSDEHKVVLLMFYFEELSYKEMADRLDVAPGTVMSRLARAKGRLRALLESTEGGDRSAGLPSMGMFV
jgi:RNA polymerase sigma-70 factor (ECF subfamily)